MTAAPDFHELHELVDRLTPAQARAVRAVVLELVGERAAESVPDDGSFADEPVRTFSIQGIMNAEPDLAERSEEILRREFGRFGE